MLLILMILISHNAWADDAYCVVFWNNPQYWKLVAALKIAKTSKQIRGRADCRSMKEDAKRLATIAGDVAAGIGQITGPIVEGEVLCACDLVFEEEFPAQPLDSCKLPNPNQEVQMEPGTYVVVNESNDRCIDVSEQDPSGHKIQSMTCNNSSNQMWRISREEKDHCFILKSQQNDMCLDVADEDLKSGGKIQAVACNESDNQRWLVVHAPNGYFFTSKRDNLCLDMRSQEANKSAGTIQQMICNGSGYQHWIPKQPR